MKKSLSTVLCLILSMCFILTSCGKKEEKTYDNLTIDKTQLELQVGEKYTYAVKNGETEINLEELVWQSSDETIATVEKGEVVAVKNGTTIITAIVDKKALTSTVTVKDKETTSSADTSVNETSSSKPQTTTPKPQTSTSSKPQAPTSSKPQAPTPSKPQAPTPSTPTPSTKTYSQQEVRNMIRVFECSIYETNSVGGVSPQIYWANTSSKDIKYIHFYLSAWNAVGDQVYCSIRGTTESCCNATGPFTKIKSVQDGYDLRNRDILCYYKKNGSWEGVFPYKIAHELAAEDGLYIDTWNDSTSEYEEYIIPSNEYVDIAMQSVWDCVWYNNTVKTVKIDKVGIEYMDGTSVELNGQSVQYAMW